MGRTQRSDLTGQVVVVTGANAGIGKETAVELAAMGATVVLACRDAGRGSAALEEVRRRSGSEQVVLGTLDLASFASIRAFAGWFLSTYDRLDVLVANAGLIVDGRQETEEGFELMFGVNHLGHFLLTDPAARTPGRERRRGSWWSPRWRIALPSAGCRPATCRARGASAA